MATIRLPPDFKEFFELFHSEGVEYLLVGGYAVGFYGHPRATGDLDIWLAIGLDNASAIARALTRFGFTSGSVPPEMFLAPSQVVRMGVPPLQIDLLTTASGVDFAACFARRNAVILDGVHVNRIGLADLEANKLAAGRLKDQSDVLHAGAILGLTPDLAVENLCSSHVRAARLRTAV